MADERGAITDGARLGTLLEQWLAATNSRDLRALTRFYPATVSAFYLARQVSRDFVLADKARFFARADRLEIQAEPPDITLAADGRTATMRFRKRYDITGDGMGRRGEVVQELVWIRTEAGWKITSERDVRVIESRRS